MRGDIQSLRGVAVLLVVLFHAGVPGFENGFLGVDVFFVISGFLVGGHVYRAQEEGRFSFKDFYLRRAKRLLPAAYSTLLFTTLLMAPLVLTTDFLNLRADVASSVGFVANIRFWRSLNYFAGAAELRPLLHLWSLSVEEQFYFFLPLLLVLLPTRASRTVLPIALVVSFMTCLLMASRSPVAAFYLLPTRAWEMLAGTLLAAHLGDTTSPPTRTPLGFIGLVALATAVWFVSDPVHPRTGAILAVTGTVLLLKFPIRIF